MKDLTFFDYKTGTVLPLGVNAADYSGCYFDRYHIIKNCLICDHQNPEWDIQQKITDNEDRFFDFSKNMIDVGAYIGIYSWNLPFQKSWMFEPNRKSYLLCCANAVLNDRIYDAFIYNELLSNTHETILFNGYDGLGHSEFNDNISSYDRMYHNPIEINTSTIDDHLDEYENIGFIKTDCEGMDWKVIDGATETIKKFNYPPILFENWPEGWVGYGESQEEIQQRNLKIREILFGMGYEILWGWLPNHEDTHLAIHKDL